MQSYHHHQYQTELLDNVIPFWLRHSEDKEHGGYFSCLDRAGAVYDTDKFVWMQGRALWMFATLYATAPEHSDWLAMAQQGAAFLEKHGRDTQGNWYFSLTQSGRPLVQPYNIFSDCFAAMGFAALYKVDSQERYADIARTTFANILKRRSNPKGIYSKTIPDTRPLKNFGLPMILCNLSLEMEHLLDKSIVDELIEEVIHEVMDTFYDEETGLILENVLQDGQKSDSFEGRLFNAGHVLEAMWFVMDLAVRREDKALVQQALERALRSLDYGWDEQYGGIFYFMDIQGHPPQQLEWDQKLWWVHLEALLCMAKAYRLTHDERALHWFEKLHDYTWSHFKDAEHPEWFGYLNRRSEVLLPLKGGKWKGCFHVPRALHYISQTLQPEQLDK